MHSAWKVWSKRFLKWINSNSVKAHTVPRNKLLTSVRIPTSESDGFIWKLIDRHVEGVRGPLTEFDSEESPLSIVQVVHRSERSEMVRSMPQKRYDTRCVQ